MKRALVIAVTRLGDLIQTEPMLRALRESGECDHVTLLLEKSFAPVGQMLEGADEIFEIDFTPLLGDLDLRASRFPLRDHALLSDWLSSSAFDRVYNVTHTRPSMVMARLASAEAQGVTLDLAGAQVARNSWLQYFFATNLARPWSSFNLVDLYVNAVAPMTDFESRRPRLKNSLQEKVQPASWNEIEVVIHAGASQSDKQWPLERFVELSDVLLKRGATVTLIGGKKSPEMSNTFPSHRRFSNRLGETSVEDLQKLFARASLLVSADSGPVHVAAACDLPVIAIEGGSAHGFETAPYMEGAFVIQPHLERLFERIPNKSVTSASAACVSVATVVSVLDSHFEHHSKFADSPGCSIYRTKRGEDTPGLELEVLSGANNQYDEWQRALRRFWWRAIGPVSHKEGAAASEIFRCFSETKRAAKRVGQAAYDVRSLESSAAALTESERVLGKELLKYPPLHHVNHFLQIARSSVSSESIQGMAGELEALYDRFADAAVELRPLLAQTPTFELAETKYREVVS
jgi:ADP-heptose:LPS heptosyltransferase